MSAYKNIRKLSPSSGFNGISISHLLPCKTQELLQEIKQKTVRAQRSSLMSTKVYSGHDRTTAQKNHRSWDCLHKINLRNYWQLMISYEWIVSFLEGMASGRLTMLQWMVPHYEYVSNMVRASTLNFLGNKIKRTWHYKWVKIRGRP